MMVGHTHALEFLVALATSGRHALEARGWKEEKL
jgi:hypothetical protein